MRAPAYGVLDAQKLGLSMYDAPRARASDSFAAAGADTGGGCVMYADAEDDAPPGPMCGAEASGLGPLLIRLSGASIGAAPTACRSLGAGAAAGAAAGASRGGVTACDARSLEEPLPTECDKLGLPTDLAELLSTEREELCFLADLAELDVDLLLSPDAVEGLDLTDGGPRSPL